MNFYYVPSISNSVIALSKRIRTLTVHLSVVIKWRKWEKKKQEKERKKKEIPQRD